jgi:hypothetical protein
MKRLTEFADKHDHEIVLAYYRPYHSTQTPSSAVGGFLKIIGTERYVYRGDYLGMGEINDLERTPFRSGTA